jgi:acyl-coenzyme A thioesterase PaaI-like protein
MIVKSNNCCFACGKGNPIGLKLHFTPTPNGVRAEFTPKKEYEGFQDIIHGGIVATILDEAIAWACRALGADSVTGEISVRYKKPMLTGVPITVFGIIEKNRGKLFLGSAYIQDKNGTVIATATAKMVRVNK